MRKRRYQLRTRRTMKVNRGRIATGLFNHKRKLKNKSLCINSSIKLCKKKIISMNNMELFNIMKVYYKNRMWWSSRSQ